MSDIGADLLSLLAKVRVFDLGGNPWESPPVPVVAKGVDAIKKYYGELEQTAAVLVDARKIVFIGHGGAGKTRYVMQLYLPHFDVLELLGYQSLWWM